MVPPPLLSMVVASVSCRRAGVSHRNAQGVRGAEGGEIGGVADDVEAEDGFDLAVIGDGAAAAAVDGGGVGQLQAGGVLDQHGAGVGEAVVFELEGGGGGGGA